MLAGTNSRSSGVIQIHYVKLFLAPVLWGGALVAGRVIANELPPLTITFLRFLCVSAFLLPVLYIKNRGFPRPTRKAALLLVLLSITGVLMFNYFLFSGLQTVTAARSSVIISFTPAFVALVSGLFFRERITPIMALGICAAFIGAVITITEGKLEVILRGGISVGDLFLLGCVLTWTVYSITAKYAMQDLTPLTVLTYGSVTGSVLLIPFAFSGGGLAGLSAQPIETWLSLLYLSIGAAGIAYLFYYEGIKAVGASRASIFLNLEPAAAITLGILLLDEQLTLPVTLGAILVIGGLFLTNYRKRSSPPE